MQKGKMIYGDRIECTGYDVEKKKGSVIYRNPARWLETSERALPRRENQFLRQWARKKSEMHAPVESRTREEHTLLATGPSSLLPRIDRKTLDKLRHVEQWWIYWMIVPKFSLFAKRATTN